MSEKTLRELIVDLIEKLESVNNDNPCEENVAAIHNLKMAEADLIVRDIRVLKEKDNVEEA